MLCNLKEFPENLSGSLTQENTQTHLLNTVVSNYVNDGSPIIQKKKERMKMVKGERFFHIIFYF